MANIDVSKITLPSDTTNTYIIKDGSAVASIARDGANYKVTKRDNSTFNIQAPIPFIVGTGTTKGTWLGTLTGLTEYYDGLLILYKPSVAGASTTTLNLNGLGAKTCYLNSNSKLTTHYPANQPILLVYSSSQNSGCWEAIDNYDSNSNTYDRNKYTGTIKAGTSALVAANIIVGKDGVFNHLKSGGAFDISYPILYLNSAVAANKTTTDTYDIIHFTVTTTQSISLTAYKPVYIKGSLSGSIFTPINTTPLTQTVPTTDDGYYYMYLGNATAATTIYLQEVHRIFAFKNGVFGEIVNSALNIPSSTTSATTGISIGDHSSTDIYGVQSSTTTASKVTLGTAISVPNVTSAGSASNWVFENVTVPKAATSATTVPIKNTNATSIPNVTAVGSGSFTSGAFNGGSGSFTATVTNGVLSFSHTHTAATHGADSHTHTAPTLGTAISIIGVQSNTTSVTGVSGSDTASHVKSGGNGTAPTLGTAIGIPNVTTVTDVTVPIKNSSATTVVTSKTHSVTDSGHTHSLS